MTEHQEFFGCRGGRRRAAQARRLAGIAALFVAWALAAGCEDAPTLPPSDPPPAGPPDDPPMDPPEDPPTDPPEDPPTDPPEDPPEDPPTDPPEDPPEDQPVDLEISWSGRAERGLALVFEATLEGEPLQPGTVAWRVEPAAAGTWRGDTLRLERAGRVHVAAGAGDASGATELDVAVPPMILFDMVVDGNRDLYRAALDGRDLERLTTDAAADYDPTVAGDLVVFVSERDGNKELYSLTLGGGAEKRLTNTAVSDVYPALSPDGKYLAFIRGSGLTRLYVAAPDASGATRPDPGHGHEGSLEIAPAWGPDGSTLVFVSTAAGSPDIYLWDGANTTLLEASSGGDFEPVISPDGRYVAFSSNRTGDVELYLLDLEDRSVRRLTEREGSDGYPAWLPDGRIVYVAYTGTTPELRWLDPVEPAVTVRIPLDGLPRNPVALTGPRQDP